MLFHIKHTTRYSYSQTVFCEPFTLRLRPREEAAQHLMRYKLVVDPLPAGITEYLDVEGNTATQCWFNQPTCSLTITANSVVETKRTNAFAFLMENDAAELPVKYKPETCTALGAYRVPAQTSGAVMELAEEIQRGVHRQTIGFLCNLAQWIRDQMEIVIRRTGDPLPPETTLAQRRGSCRDLAVLFIEACRSMGLASRFVSGYQAHPDDDGPQDLHAWAEVYLPGAGWRGFDPTQGLAVADGHVAVASGLAPLAAAPTAGAYRGTGATSSMDVQVVVRVS
jgi:transglutaminase-like putative cysteine protease